MDAKDLMRELAERIGQTADVKAVFGEPMGQGSEMVIPVARIAVRGGGGGGVGDMPTGGNEEGRATRKGSGSGMGLGLNITTTPVGYIRLTPERAEFVPVVDRGRVILAGMIVGAMALWVLKVAVKAAMKR